MRQSHLFTKTRKEVPKDEVSKNAQLLTRAGFIHKEMAGVYTYLPLGLRTVRNIERIIREEMNAIGGVELFMTALQDQEVWKASGRWSDEAIDVWFKTRLANDVEVGLGNTHEEPITNLMKQHLASYRDLPVYAYQFQTKFRNELRAKSGLLRAREFIMKDLYSFSRDAAEHEAFYEKAKEAYLKIFERAGIGEKTYMTFASGGSFSTYSHEFQTVCAAGEDSIYVDDDQRLAVNKEVYTHEVLRDLAMQKESLREEKAIEVGNIFSLGTRFSDALGLRYRDENGEEHPVVMGSYGIGPGRLVGTIVEVLSDEKGIIWPDEVAPFQVHLISLGSEKPEVKKEAEHLYETIGKEGIEVLYDDRDDASAGEKLAEADLIGIPFRAIVSERTIKEGRAEIKRRDEQEPVMVTLPNVVSYLKEYR